MAYVTNKRAPDRVSGLIGDLNPTESLVVGSLLSGRSPGIDLARARGRERATLAESKDVARVMASERVRRAIAGVTEAVRPSDLRRYVLEGLVKEADEAREGSVRLKALEHLGNLPGVDLWQPEASDTSLAATGQELAQALAALEQRLGQEVIDAESEEIPDAPADGVIDGDADDMPGEDDAGDADDEPGGDPVQAGPNHPAPGRLPWESE